MILNAFYNELNQVLIITTTKAVATTKKIDDIVFFYDAVGTLIGMNIFNVSGYQAGIVPLSELPETITKQFNLDPHPDPFVYGYITKVTPHPHADKLKICQVDLGFESLKIVCGAANCAPKHKVVVARIGAVMPNGMPILPAKVQKESSDGMLCSFQELGIKQEKAKGIILLSDNNDVGCAVQVGLL